MTVPERVPTPRPEAACGPFICCELLRRALQSRHDAGEDLRAVRGGHVREPGSHRPRRFGGGQLERRAGEGWYAGHGVLSAPPGTPSTSRSGRPRGFFPGYVSGIRFLSARHYATALMHGLDPRRFVDAPHVGTGVAVAVAAGVVALFLFPSIERLRRMDVP